MDAIAKYPRTRHVYGSRLQHGDEDLEAVRFETLRGKYLVIEEKVDGANSGISFDSESLELRLQSRGHYLGLEPSYRERHFNLFKKWAVRHESWLMEKLQDKYIAYGEWLYAKHTEYYDQLPHYWMEFDVLEKKTGKFLSTAKRKEFWKGCPVVSVPVVHAGPLKSIEEVAALIRPSLYKSPNWKLALAETARMKKLDLERIVKETDPSDLAEGVYIKFENDDETVERYKYVRHEFIQAIKESDSHWQSRPIVENRLAAGVDIFAGDV